MIGALPLNLTKGRTMKIWNLTKVHYGPNGMMNREQDKGNYASNSVKALLRHICKKYKLKLKGWQTFDRTAYCYADEDEARTVWNLDLVAEGKLIEL